MMEPSSEARDRIVIPFGVVQIMVPADWHEGMDLCGAVLLTPEGAVRWRMMLGARLSEPSRKRLFAETVKWAAKHDEP